MPHLSLPRPSSLSLSTLNLVLPSCPKLPGHLSASPGEGELWSCLWRCLRPLGSSPSDKFMEAEKHSEWPFSPHLLPGRGLFITFCWHLENVGFGGAESPDSLRASRAKSFLGFQHNPCYNRSWSLCLTVKQSPSACHKHISSVCRGEQRWPSLSV